MVFVIDDIQIFSKQKVVRELHLPRKKCSI